MVDLTPKEDSTSVPTPSAARSWIRSKVQRVSPPHKPLPIFQSGSRLTDYCFRFFLPLPLPRVQGCDSQERECGRKLRKLPPQNRGEEGRGKNARTGSCCFPNSDFHEPVTHYVDEEETESEHSVEDRPSTWEGHEDEEYTRKARRDSTKISWEQLEMQRHHERMEQERQANKTTAKQHTKQASQGPWWNPGLPAGVAPVDRDFRDMQTRARPPMLGEDLTFPAAGLLRLHGSMLHRVRPRFATRCAT